MVLALHTAGDLLNFHPHIHALTLAGEFTPLPAVDTARLEKLFSNYVFEFLLEHKLITPDVVYAMQGWEHSGFHVFSGDEIAAEDADRRRFTARYLRKCPVALSRLELIENELAPVVRVIKSAEQPGTYRDFSPLEFLAELSQHIPNTYEQMTRFYGCYSCRARGKKRKQARVTLLLSGNLAELEEREPPAVSRYWATWIKKVYEVDPLVCPKCGCEMKIVGFVHDPKTIKDICTSLGIADWRAPPPIKTVSHKQPVIIPC
jgi:hypothetical protein